MRLWILLSSIVTTGWCCGFPGAPAHSSVVVSSEGAINVGTVASYSCDRGFELLGPARKICTENGTWTPPGIPFCVLNVAAGKAPMQSSVDGGGIPQRAVDGSTSTSFNPETCSLTEHERSPWWYVNLLEPYMVQLVRIDFGGDCCGSQPAVLEVRVGNNRPDLGENPVCNRFEGFLEEGRPLFLPCSPPMPGAFVSVHFVEPLGAQLSICETFVYTDQALPIERCPSFRDQPPGSTATYNGKCYIFYNQNQMNFDDAHNFCQSRGGSLLDETNPALQGFLSWELWRRHRGESNGQYWLGAVRDPVDPNNWRWINGRDVTISFWNLPGGNENCARFDGTKGWLWSDTNCLAKLNFICQHRPQTCGKPEQPPNSTMIAPNFQVGSEVRYECDEGHVLVGPTTRTCLNSGFFNEFPPNCQYIKCGPAAPIRNGLLELVNGTSHYLSTVRYSCSPGYVMVGRSELICDADGRWNGPPPRCTAMSCPIGHVVNGYNNLTSLTLNFGEVALFSCNKGFSIVGRRIVRCVTGPKLNRELPKCKAETPLKPGLDHDPSEEVPVDSLSPPYDTNRVEGDSVVQDSAPTYVKVRPPTFDETDESNDVSLRNNGGPPAVDRPSYTEGGGAFGNAKIPLGGIIALGVFGGLVFLAAILTTIVILARRTQGSSKTYVRRHDDVTTSSDSSSSDGHGLNKYYKRAWENLGGDGAGPSLGRDTEKGMGGGSDRRGMGGTHGTHEGLRDGSEMTVNDVAAMYTRPEKRRHHHHHSHRHHKGHEHEKDRHDREWRGDRDRRKY